MELNHYITSTLNQYSSVRYIIEVPEGQYLCSTSARIFEFSPSADGRHLCSNL